MSIYLDSIRKVAMLAIKKPDDQAVLREIFREYSKMFYTPLHVVEDLPLEFVLLNYYENKYGAILDKENGEEELNTHLRHLLSTPEERQKQAREEEENELKMLEELEQEAAKEKQKEEFKKLKNTKSLKPVQENQENSEEIQFEENLL